MITIAPITWTVRTGPAHTGYGAPYDGVATVQRCGDVARVILARLNWKRLNAEDKAELAKLKEWFGHEAAANARRLQES